MIYRHFQEDKNDPIIPLCGTTAGELVFDLKYVNDRVFVTVVVIVVVLVFV